MQGKRRFRDEVFNIPNILTYGRIGLIPLVLVFLAQDTPGTSFIAALLMTAASVTDFLDGYVAKKYNMVSTLGKYLDPLADKLIVMSTLVMLVHMDRLAAWVCILLLARDFSITGLRGIASNEGLVLAAINPARYKTAFQLVGILCLIIHFPYHVDYVVVSGAIDFHVVGIWLVAISLFFSLFSAVLYFRSFVKAVLEKEAREAGKV